MNELSKELMAHGNNAAMACIKLLPKELREKLDADRNKHDGTYVTLANQGLLAICGLTEDEAYSVLSLLGSGQLRDLEG